MKILIILMFCSVMCYAQSDVPGEYAKASTQLLTSEDILFIGLDELGLMRNEIFARYGYIFKKEEYRDYFSEQSWYKPTIKDVNAITAKLTEIEKSNIALIMAREAYLRPVAIRKLPLLELPLDLEAQESSTGFMEIIGTTPTSSRGAPFAYLGLLPDTTKYYAVLWYSSEPGLSLSTEFPARIYFVTTYSKKLKLIATAWVSLAMGSHFEFGATDCVNKNYAHKSYIYEDMHYVSVYSFDEKCPDEKPKIVEFEVSGKIKSDGTFQVTANNNPIR